MEYFSFSKLVFQKFLMKKKIIIYSNNYWNLYNFRINLINYFIKKNFEVILVGQGDGYLSKFENLNIKCFELNLNKSNFNILHNFIFFYKFYFILKKIKPQYILSFTIKPNIFSGRRRYYNDKTIDLLKKIHFLLVRHSEALYKLDTYVKENSRW